MALDINYTPPPTGAKFMESDAKMRVLMGPVGSENTYWIICIFQPIKNQLETNERTMSMRSDCNPVCDFFVFHTTIESNNSFEDKKWGPLKTYKVLFFSVPMLCVALIFTPRLVYSWSRPRTLRCRNDRRVVFARLLDVALCDNH